MSNNIGKTHGVMYMERTFVMIKPDGVKRKLVGEIIQRLENKGLLLEQARMLTIPVAMAEEHYKEHNTKSFYARLVSFICSGPVIAMVWQGPDVIALTRTMVGNREPLQAAPGTIRGDFAFTSTENLVHAADSPEAAEREIKLFFGGNTA